MQKLEEFLHYRNLDVSTLKELYKSWKGDIGNLPVKKSNHRAMTDILESIDEMKWYKENFLSFQFVDWNRLHFVYVWSSYRNILF